MTYFVSEDTNMSGEWIQLIPRSVDIKARQLESLSVCLSVGMRLHIHIEHRRIGFFTLDRIRK